MKQNKEPMPPTSQTSQGQRGTIMPRGIYIRTKIDAQNREKRAIAVKIASYYIKDFQAVLLDAGSTAELVAEELFARRKFLSVMTNNMGAYAAFTRARTHSLHASHATERTKDQAGEGGLSGNELLITGGRYVDTFESLLGEAATDTIRSFTPNVTVIGISGLRCPDGVFCHGAEESNVKKLLWDKPTDLMLVTADWTKIGKRDAHRFGEFHELGNRSRQVIVITCNPPKSVKDGDLEAFDEQLKLLTKLNIQVDRLDSPSV